MNNLLPCPFCGGEFEIITGQFAQGSAVLFHGAHMCNVLGRQISTRWCNAEKDVAEIINRRAQPSEKPLTLEELRKMDGETVFVGGSEFWVSGSGTVSVEDGGVFDPDDQDGYWPFENYGEWIAFRSKPKEEA